MLLYQWNCLTADASGNLFVSYYAENGTDIKMALYEGATWSTFWVDGDGTDAGPTSSIVVDLDGVPHITYKVAGVGLKHARMSTEVLRRYTGLNFQPTRSR